MTPAVSLYAQVASATTDGVSSVDGVISDTANPIPVVEPVTNRMMKPVKPPLRSVTISAGKATRSVVAAKALLIMARTLGSRRPRKFA